MLFIFPDGKSNTCSLLKNLENIIPKRIKEKTESSRLLSAFVWKLQNYPRPHFELLCVLQPMKKPVPACFLFWQAPRNMYSTRSRESEGEKAILSRVSSGGLWKPGPAVCPLEGSRLPVCAGVRWHFLEFNCLPLSTEEGDSLETQALQNGNSIIGINVFILFPWSLIIKYVPFCFWFILLARHLTQVKLLTFSYATKFSLDWHSY